MNGLETFGDAVRCDTYQDNFLEISIFPHGLDNGRVKMSGTVGEQGFTIEYIKSIIGSILGGSKKES